MFYNKEICMFELRQPIKSCVSRAKAFYSIADNPVGARVDGDVLRLRA